MLKSLSLLWLLVRPHLARQKKLLLLSLVLMACATAASLLAPWLVKKLIDAPLPGGDMRHFVVDVAKAALVYLLAFGLWAAQQTVAASVAERVFADVKVRFLKHLFNVPRSFYDRLSDADLASRLESNLRFAAVSFRDDVLAGLFEILFILGIVCAVTVVQWRVGVCMALALAVYAAVVAAIERPWLHRAEGARASRSAQRELFVDILGATRDIRVFNLGRSVEQQFTAAVREVAATQIRLNQFSAVLRNIFGLMGALVALLVIAFYGGQIILQRSPETARISVGELVVVFAILGILLNTLNQILLRAGRLIEAEPSLRKVVEVMAFSVSAGQGAASTGFSAAIPDQPALEFVNICYSRTLGVPLLDNFNLVIDAGEKVALLGPTGTGKSTLLDLLMRLRDPSAGRILFSSIDIRQIEPAFFYSAFGFVGQQTHVMQGSLRQFLQQGWPDQLDSDLWRVLDLLKLSTIVLGMPQQLDTQVGFGGWVFSNSQRQRLAVARALLRDPQVLVLDEFTATLDAEAELALVRDVLVESKRRSVICTTYSSAVAALFDRVVAL